MFPGVNILRLRGRLPEGNTNGPGQKDCGTFRLYQKELTGLWSVAMPNKIKPEYFPVNDGSGD
ncbi:hypothetical protein AGMMS49579_12930 [Spirochaetia bacterium]|nr:hypothetical protein AGMMS49579_12930 [Spirochaetia bacterium]